MGAFSILLSDICETVVIVLGACVNTNTDNIHYENIQLSPKIYDQEDKTIIAFLLWLFSHIHKVV